MVGDISLATRTEVLGAIRSRYREASKKDKSRMLDEFVAHIRLPQKARSQTLGSERRSGNPGQSKRDNVSTMRPFVRR